MEAVILFLLLCSSFSTLRGNDLIDAGGVARVPRLSSLSEGRGTVSVQSNSKPTFKNCSKYQPSVLEETEPGRHVLTVQAEDRDPPDAGGTLTYSFVTALGEREKFRIDNVTGEITTKQPFDRDEPSREKEVYIAVRATDNGRPQLDDICSIKVVIEDINDNRPIFDKVSYHESVPKDLKVGREVMRISATDIDDGKNSIVSYILMSERDASDMNYFRIDENTGVIFLNKSIDKPVDYKFKMKARAMDHGKPSLEQDIGVEITVVGSNRKAPTFLKTPDTLYIKENHTDFSTPLITIQASSNIPNDTPVFELLIGRTEQTNKQNTFVLEQHNDTAYIKLGKRLDYEAINEYQLIVRVQNKDNLAAQQFIVIKVEDVNDVIPVFIDIVPGSVLENEPPGTPVMQVRAIDLDGTTAHNQVTYELENVTEVQERFQIDPHTGNITTKVKFDREEKDFYKVKVIATDSSPSALFHDGRHNKGEHTFRIEIADINDNQPRFTKKMYIFEEIPEDANLNQQVGEVRAEDKDSASPVTYSIIDGNIGNAFLIENTTGKIRVKNALDYEIRTEYMLTVRAFDGAYKDEANVSIKIGNVNDNPPIFLPYNKNITIKEEELPEEECITKLEAYDPDIVNRSWPQHIVYFVVKEDQKDKLKINKDGCLSLIKSLDRDPPNGYDEWQVFIAADDEDGDVKSLRQTTDFLIHLIDINDNAPFLDMVQPVIWMENQPPGNITVLTAKDYDSDENGPPFKFVIDENASEDIKRKFYIVDATLFANVTFDREEKKVYHIPIAITDSGVPPLTNTSFLMVVIGDVNDNAMKSGESSIFVYNYKGKAPDTVIGRVYVDDPDDWDIVDKHFRWKSDNVNQPFWLDTETGMITMLSGTSNSSFRLEFIVTEKSALIKEHFVEAAVNVTVKELPEEAVDKSGSIRFAGVSAEDFIAPGPNLKPSKLAQFSAYLANILNTSEENIDTFTVLHSPHNNDSNLLDVRFSVHGSPYYHPEKLNAIVGEHQEKLEIELGVEVVMINIDECLIEKAFCSELSCTNILNKSEVPYPVYTNTSSFVGVKAFVDPVCECQINPPKTKCLNGGTPLEDRCECNPGFEGPNCEILSVGFHGDGWALYPPVPACKEASLSLDITPTKDDGLILYVGPIRRNTVLNVQDFMSLELKDGYPRLLMDYGSGTTFLEHKQSRLSDGKLHHIDIFWTNTSIEMKVDSCQMSSCLRLTTPIKPNEFLNVNGPLQLGGSFVDLASLSKEMLWNYAPSDEKFSGCIRNLTFNGKTYNLGMPSHFKNIDPGCNKGLAKAVSFGIDTNFLVAILVCIAILLILLLAVVVHRRKTDDMYKDTDDIRENIINYEDEGGGEGDMTGYDLNVLRLMYDNQEKPPVKENIQTKGPDEVPDICGFLDDKKKVCDNDPETNPFDDVRHYAYEGDGNTTGSLSSLASGTDEGDLNFDYLSNFGPRFRKLADMYGEEPSDEEETFQNPASESWC